MQGTVDVLETVITTYLRLILLPFLRLPMVKTTLKVVDYFGSKFVRLFEDSIPRLRDHLDPMAFDGELIFTLVFLPMSMCMTIGHRILEGLAGQLVVLFPPLKEAHRNFDQKGLIGQWMTLLLMAYLYLPLQFLSHPSESIQYFLGIPSRVCWAVFDWNISNVRMVFNEALEWVQWTSYTFSNYILFAQNLTVTAVDYWYYIVLRMTGLEDMLAWAVRTLRDFLKRSDGTLASIIMSVGQSAVSVWLGEFLSAMDFVAVRFVKSVWNGESREELKTRPRSARTPAATRQQQQMPESAASVAGPSSSAN